MCGEDGHDHRRGRHRQAGAQRAAQLPGGIRHRRPHPGPLRHRPAAQGGALPGAGAARDRRARRAGGEHELPGRAHRGGVRAGAAFGLRGARRGARPGAQSGGAGGAGVWARQSAQGQGARQQRAPDPQIRELQEALRAFGIAPGLAVDGRLGPKTRAALVAFQRMAEIPADGIYGPVTKAALRLRLDAIR
ncbi:MAG: peptidoglycan-binding domain-containing protein [Anaerolineales bacterium]